MNEQTMPANVGSNDGLGVAPKRTKPLSYRQSQVLNKAPNDWGKLPGGIGCTNATLEALEKRGLVETEVRQEKSTFVPGAWLTAWYWRKTPNA